MRAKASGVSNRYLISGLGAVLVTVLLVLLFRSAAPPARLVPAVVAPQPKATVNIAKLDDSNRLLKEEAELRDMRPLFLPTERNAALPEPRLETGRTFLDNETLKLAFKDAEAHISRDLPPVALLDGRRVEEARANHALTATENPLSLQGFGRGEARIVPFSPRAAYLRVTALRDGKAVLDEELPPTARPPVDKAWAPIELVATVDDAGLVGPLVVTEGSRVEETDAHFKNYLDRIYRIGHRLPAGFYRITVSP